MQVHKALETLRRYQEKNRNEAELRLARELVCQLGLSRDEALRQAAAIIRRETA